MKRRQEELEKVVEEDNESYKAVVEEELLYLDSIRLNVVDDVVAWCYLRLPIQIAED